jgi:hypothetical protein
MYWWWVWPRQRAARAAVVRRRLWIESLESRNLLTVGPSLGVPAFSSRPGAPATLYLDFDGNVEQQWGNHANVVTPPYDTDGNKSSFSAGEIAAIDEIWARVAEDYAPFNLNVTTVPPPRIGDRVAARVAIGGSYSDWYGGSAGGVSFVGGFSSGASNVAYVFSNSLNSGNPTFVAEAASHEAGHLFGLEHQATWSGTKLVSEYNAGTAGWAPIMGNSYYADRTTWANGATSDSPTLRQDELSVIASTANGFGYAADDFGNTIATAAALPLTGSTTRVNGLIGKNDDRDIFKFMTNGGTASFAVDVAPFGPDLDAALELQNASGTPLVVANSTMGFDASLSKTLAAGTYYLVVHSSGGYGNLGRYVLSGTISAAVATPSSQPPPSPTPTTTPSPTPTTSTTTSSNAAIANDATAAFASAGAWTKLTGVGYSNNAQWSAAGSGTTATWTFSGLTPGQYQIAATWFGSALNATDAPFSIASGAQSLASVRVNQQRAASTFSSGGVGWQNLGTVTIVGNTLTVRLNSSASGRVIADAIRIQRVTSTSGGI